MRSFSDLTEREILALAISNEEEDGRIYADFAEGLQENYPESAKVFLDMAAEENEHRRMLIDKFVEKFGNHIPLVRRQHIRGYIQRRPLWQVRPLGIEAVRRQAVQMEEEARPLLSAGGEPGDGRKYPQAPRRSCRSRSRACPLGRRDH